MPRCLIHAEEELEATRKGWFCSICEKIVLDPDGRPRPNVLAAAAPSAAVAYPPGLDPPVMPTYLAHPWAAFCSETHPRIQLFWLTDTAEVGVRWAVAVALAEVVAANGRA